ncbi:class I adenylate-forming enzyme family protein [Nocardia farcinica]|uniref:class I adenylate-forming enzyme family protein n=1 Tax=Nocardia farcinica TaxID=37329 RepID=UPI000E07D572|nr:AMP-binding protein [Nocardia farcinica]MBF6139144.1 AMP-binding protein [Nocardia farcinica]MBF6293392.1 AMP-binding protein [Nocardia farcinica]MBF6374257.1 AMP-binding protein [Nocardia farcinica]MBF6379824.1 AMP-binding protein [Nocardia farcinica]MBF6573563.1 AMP-binding protein [Nocardia farcinica]
MRNVIDIPAERARTNPCGPCVSDEREELDNAEFARRVDIAAAVLHSRGIRKGDVVAVVLPNRVELVVLLFAAWRLGAAVTPVRPDATEDELRYQILDAGARVVVAEDGRDPGFLDVARVAGPDADADVPAPSAAADPHATALIIYTSGTTGRPKGVVLDHANIAAMCAMIVDALGLDETDHSLLVLPLFHVNGIVVSILSPLLTGGRATIAGRFSASAFFPLVERVRPTYFSAVPAIYAMLVAQPAEVRPDTSSLRRAICGAAPMPAELIARFETRFGVPIVEGYGLSEGTCASTINPPAGPRKPGTVGVPLPGQTVAIMGADGALLAPGARGEVVIRGANVMRGYLGKPEATAATVVDGWLHTGDVGYFDPDGYLVLVDRIKDMIIRGGENIYPKEIENVLHSHPAVLESAVVGAPDPVLGEVPVAHVVTMPGTDVSEAELVAHCRHSLARDKVPVAVRITDALPRNAVGKIDKKALRAISAAA